MNTFQRILLILLGLALLMAGLWGGSWLLYANPDQYNFAAFCTAFILCSSGLGCVIAAVVDKVSP